MKSPDLKLHLAILAIIAVMCFAWGRYSVTPTKISANVITTTDVVKDVVTDRVTTTTETPGGPKSTTVTEHITSETNKTHNKTSVVTSDSSRPTLNISLLAATNINEAFKPLYGVSVSKQVVGPVTAGLFVLSGGTIGVSVGINF